MTVIIRTKKTSVNPLSKNFWLIFHYLYTESLGYVVKIKFYRLFTLHQFLGEFLLLLLKFYLYMCSLFLPLLRYLES